MTWLLGFYSTLMIAYAASILEPFENDIVNFVIRFVILLVANVLLAIASDHYEKLKSRVKTLEDKVENNAEHIYKLAKKQSDKIIEFSIE